VKNEGDTGNELSTVAQRDDRQWLAREDFGIPKKCIFVDKQSGKDFDRPAKLISNLVIQVFSYVAETERNMNHQRTMEGLAARARGVTLCRKPMEKPAGFPAIHAQWEAGKVSARKDAEALGVSTPTFLKWANASTDA